MVHLPRLLLVCIVLVLLGAAPAQGAGRLDHLQGGMQLGIFSPPGQAAAERSGAALSMRYLYVTSDVGDGTRRRPGSPGGTIVSDWLTESAREGMTPVLTYYQLLPSSPGTGDEKARVAATLRDKDVMRSYWREVRDVLKLAGANGGQPVVLHIEPDGWQFFEQLQGLRTRAMVSRTGLRELRGLPNDVRGFARAFVRLRDRYAPNVALGWHLSAWGMGQAGQPSVENSESIGHLRAAFMRSTGARFDVVLHDPIATTFDARFFAQHLALLRAFHDDAGLPLVLWQTPADMGVAWLLGDDAAARAHLDAERAVGVVAALFDGGVPERPAAGRDALLGLAGRTVVDDPRR